VLSGCVVNLRCTCADMENGVVVVGGGIGGLAAAVGLQRVCTL